MGRTLPEDIRALVLRRDDSTCRACALKTPAPIAHHLDPVCGGGTNEPDNLITLCRLCHAFVHGWWNVIHEYVHKDWLTNTQVFMLLYAAKKYPDVQRILEAEGWLGDCSRSPDSPGSGGGLRWSGKLSWAGWCNFPVVGSVYSMEGRFGPHNYGGSKGVVRGTSLVREQFESYNWRAGKMRLATDIKERARVTRYTREHGYNALAVGRTAAGLLQREVAAACGVSQQCIALLETGRRKPSAALAKRLARLLRTTPERLFPETPYSGVLISPVSISAK